MTVFQLNYKNVFADATYALNRNRQIKLRRPQELPADEDVKKLKDYTVRRINDLLCDPYQTWDTHSFVEIRDLTVCRLTVFNARRGGEPARLVISEWLDAEHNRWLRDGGASCPQQTSPVTSVEFSTFKNLKVTYQGGKGVNHLVPVLIPSDVFEAMRVLSDDSIRQSAGVHPENKYMFPSTQFATTHVNGWQAVHKVCVSAQIQEPEKMTATKMRHRVSTLYAAMDIPENERHLFYKHMGHSEAINQHIYQAPLAEAEVVKVGRCLMTIDGDSNKTLEEVAAAPVAEDIPMDGGEDRMAGSYELSRDNNLTTNELAAVVPFRNSPTGNTD